MINRQNLASSYIFQPPSSDNEKKELSNLVDNLSNVGKIALVINGQEIEVPSVIYFALTEVVKTLNNGDSVTLIPMDKELTTQQAADILNVSRPYFIKLLENGTIKKIYGNATTTDRTHWIYNESDQTITTQTEGF